MKYVIIAVALILLAAGSWFYWGQPAPEAASVPGGSEVSSSTASLENVPNESASEMEVGRYAADVAESSIAWEAGKPAISGYVHHGTFTLRSGSVTLTETDLQGEFVVDMDSIKIKSLGGGKAGQESALEGHLKGERFFDTSRYPTATFTITGVDPKVLPGPERSDYTATGELTMKGETKTVSFPIKVTVASNDEVWMTASLPIDRTEWGISFGSAKIVEAITDQVIGDTVNLDLVVKLTK